MGAGNKQSSAFAPFDDIGDAERQQEKALTDIMIHIRFLNIHDFLDRQLTTVALLPPS
jgi:hypothetical protein